MKHIIPILIVLLLLSSGFVGVSNHVEEQRLDAEQKSTVEGYAYNRFNEHHYPEGYFSGQNPQREYEDVVSSEEVIENEEKTLIGNKYHKPQQTAMSGGPMDSPWPMHGYDIRHTGRSPYGTTDNPGIELWRFRVQDKADCSPVIDNDGTIYIGSTEFYAVNPNGTLKWKYDVPYRIFSSAPAIDENGIVYVGTIWAMPNYLYALYTTNGTLKWRYDAGDSLESSPAIGDDGTIYFGEWDGHFHAVYPNGTRKWRYKTGDVISSSPAIGEDGTVYVGSHDDYVYAFYPNNGTVKWKFKTGAWVHGIPTIGDDGTVYIGSDDDYLYAFYPNNGTVKWQCQIGATWASPTLDEEGTLYIGVWDKNFRAIYPNGTIKWSFYLGDHRVWGSSAAISADGTIYFGTSDISGSAPWALDIIALNPDGTEKWRHFIETSFSSPAIGSDGTVYIGSCGQPGEGFLHAFGIGELEAYANGPYYGLVGEPIQFEGSSKGGYSPHSYHWDFGDSETSDEQNPTHTYTYPDNFTVTLTVTDDSSNTSDDTTWAWIQASNDPPDKPSIDGPTSGAVGVEYDYTFVTTDPDSNDVGYSISWGGPDYWVYGPFPSGEELTLSHSWSEKGIYTIECFAYDVYGELSEIVTLEVTMPMNQQMYFLRWLERFPRLQWLLDVLGWYEG